MPSFVRALPVSLLLSLAPSALAAPGGGGGGGGGDTADGPSSAVTAARSTGDYYASPAPGDEFDLVISGPGTFISATQSIQDLVAAPFFSVFVDGEFVYSGNAEAATNLGLNQPNTSGVMVADGLTGRTMIVSPPSPLRFESELRVQTVMRTNPAAGVFITVVHGD